MDDALVGRGPELVVLGDFLTRSAADGGALLLTGEPGVGKTALLQAAATRAAQADTRVLQTAGSAVEMISFSGLTQVVMPLLAYDDCLSADQREAVSVALGLADGRPPQPAAISQAVLALLRAVARQVPILIVVDDLQWLDPFSGDVLRFVARRVPGSRIGVLAASRPPAPGHLGLDGVPSYHLAALDPAASDVLLRARFPALPPRVRHRLLDEAAGQSSCLARTAICPFRKGTGLGAGVARRPSLERTATGHLRGPGHPAAPGNAGSPLARCPRRNGRPACPARRSRACRCSMTSPPPNASGSSMLMSSSTG